jgi:hypothetical protein
MDTDEDHAWLIPLMSRATVQPLTSSAVEPMTAAPAPEPNVWRDVDWELAILCRDERLLADL